MPSIQRQLLRVQQTRAMTPYPALERLIATMATLRGPEGCPWDALQDHQSLVPYLLEETFELIEALESGSSADIREELGDVLYQLLFHADLAAANLSDPFDIDDVAGEVEEKMRQRHPHVFADGDAVSVAEVKERWDEIKAEQKKHRTSAYEGIPGKLSALARADSFLKRGGESIVPPQSEARPGVGSERELGELLFALVADSRTKGFDAERALRAHLRELEAGESPTA